MRSALKMISLKAGCCIVLYCIVLYCISRELFDINYINCNIIDKLLQLRIIYHL